VELLQIEYKLNPSETFRAFEACDEKGFSVSLNGNSNFEFSSRTLLNHIDNYPGDKVFGLGLKLDPMGKKYDQYLLSGKLSRLGPAVLMNIIEEGGLVADKIYIYDPGKAAEKCLEEIVNAGPKV
jgi:hypothetical protein